MALMIESQPAEQEAQQGLDEFELFALMKLLYQVDVLHAGGAEVAFRHVYRRIRLEKMENLNENFQKLMCGTFGPSYSNIGGMIRICCHLCSAGNP